MRIDTLQQYVKLRRELTQERDQMSQRLNQINEALGELSAVAPASEPAAASEPSPSEPERSPAQKPKATGSGRGRAASGGGQSLREHVLEVLRNGSMTSREVLDAVQKRGYKFSTNNPLNSLGVILYGKNPKFNRVDGRFSLKGGAAVSGGNAVGNGKRTMSPAARARIAEAQRQRWAATRKPQGNTGKPAAASKNGSSGSDKRTFSPAARAAIAAAARKRWAAAKRAGKNSL
jgi:hypothetical protein